MSKATNNKADALVKAGAPTTGVYGHLLDLWRTVKCPDNGKPLHQGYVRIFMQEDDSFEIRLSWEHGTPWATVYPNNTMVMGQQPYTCQLTMNIFYKMTACAQYPYSQKYADGQRYYLYPNKKGVDEPLLDGTVLDVSSMHFWRILKNPMLSKLTVPYLPKQYREWTNELIKELREQVNPLVKLGVIDRNTLKTPPVATYPYFSPSRHFVNVTKSRMFVSQALFDAYVELTRDFYSQLVRYCHAHTDYDYVYLYAPGTGSAKKVPAGYHRSFVDRGLNNLRTQIRKHITVPVPLSRYEKVKAKDERAFQLARKSSRTRSLFAGRDKAAGYGGPASGEKGKVAA